MAIIQPTLGDIRGSLGGVTFQDSPYGNVLRSKPYPKKGSTAAQTARHSLQQAQVQAWHSLTFSQRLAWNSFAALYTKVNKFGVSMTLNGFQWFNSVNQQLTAAGQPNLTSPPSYAPATAVLDFLPVLSSSIAKLVFDSTPDFMTYHYSIFATPPLTQVSGNQLRKLRQIGVFSSAPGDEIDVTAEWEAAFNMSYEPVTYFPGAVLQFSVQTIMLSTGITSPFRTERKPTPTS